MIHPNILVTDGDGVFTIEISRREKKNAITGDMYRAMSTALCHARESLAAAKKLAALPAQSLAVTKALMKRPPERSAIDAMDEEVIFFSDLVAAPAAKEIFSAFLEKRPPDPEKIHGHKP